MSQQDDMSQQGDIDARLAAIEARLAAVEARPAAVTWVPLTATGSWMYSNPVGYQCPRCRGWVQPCAGHWCGPTMTESDPLRR